MLLANKQTGSMATNAIAMKIADQNKMKLGIWQIIYIGILCLGLGVAAAKHGQPRTDKYNFWVQLVSVAITITILAFGGFFG